MTVSVSPMFMKTGTTIVVGALSLCALTACSKSAATAPATTSTSVPSGPVYAKPGPYVAGVTTLHMGDTLVEVWYPADRGSEAGKQPDAYQLADWLPPALRAKVPPGTATFTTNAYRDLPASSHGPYPLVLFSHGFAGYRDQSTFLTTHLATWGFVVAAPDVASRDLASVFGQTPAKPQTDAQVLRATVDLMKAENGRSGGPLAGRVDSAKLAVMGHSSGGFDAIQFGAQPDVATYVSLAAGGKDDNGNTVVPPDKPSLYMVGADDTVVPATDVDATFGAAPGPKRLVTIARSGHLVFADICLIGASRGGVTAIATAVGITIPPDLLKLANDGCGPAALPVTEGYPVIDHYVVAHLRSVFGIDPHPVGLSDDVKDDFQPAVVAYQHTP
jgi:dienelactone hydrolase